MSRNPDTPPADESELLTAKELAAKLKTSDRCIRYWAADGIIPEAVRVGRIIRFREADVMAALEAATVGAANVVGEQVVRLALAYLDPDLMEKPGWLIVREPTEDEDKRASEIAAVLWSTYHAREYAEEKRAFAQGVIDAVAVGQNLDEVLKRTSAQRATDPVQWRQGLDETKKLLE